MPITGLQHLFPNRILSSFPFYSPPTPNLKPSSSAPSLIRHILSVPKDCEIDLSNVFCKRSHFSSSLPHPGLLAASACLPSPPHLPSSVCAMCDFWQRVLEIQFWSYLLLHSKPRAKATEPNASTFPPEAFVQTEPLGLYIPKSLLMLGPPLSHRPTHFQVFLKGCSIKLIPTWFSFP